MKLLFKNKETFFGVFFLLLSLYILWEISRFVMPAEKVRSLGPGVFPNVLASSMAVLSVLLIIQGLRNPPAPIFPAKYFTSLAAAPGAILFGCISFMLLIDTLGFLLWSILFLAALQYALGERRAPANLVISVSFALIMYGIFGVGLGVPLPKGPLPI